MQRKKYQKECVIVLHGIAKSTTHTQALADYISLHGFTTFNIEYPSTRFSIESLVDNVHSSISSMLMERCVDKCRPTHFVGYSMGGIIVRALLLKYRPKMLGRVVQIASPNHGSEVVDFLKKHNLSNMLFKLVCGPAGQQLGTNSEIMKELSKTEIDYELGVIAGKTDGTLLSTCGIMHSTHDGRVSVESTLVQGMKDHVVIDVGHLAAPHNDEVKEQTVYFLANGHFRHDIP